MRVKTFFLYVVMFAVVLAGCKDENNPTAAGGGSTSYTGIMAGGGVSGSISINIPTPKRAYSSVSEEGDTLEITGTLKLNGGATIALSGYYVVLTDELYLAGGGYYFFGFVDEGNVSGTFNSPGGSGVFSAEEGGSSSVKTYCGTFQDNSPGIQSGYFNMIINGTSVIVIVSPSDGGGASYIGEGTLTNGTIIAIYDPETPGFPVATGTLNTSNNTVSGTYIGDPGGTWSGAPCN
jgi:hypothetical protein